MDKVDVAIAILCVMTFALCLLIIESVVVNATVEYSVTPGEVARIEWSDQVCYALYDFSITATEQGNWPKVRYYNMSDQVELWRQLADDAGNNTIVIR